MSKGRSHYFRHHNNARNDEKIQNLISKNGYAAYGRYFAIIEMCSQKYAESGMTLTDTYTFNESHLCKELKTNRRVLENILNCFQIELLLNWIRI